ncbi:hypothetical protein PTI98_010811 [Pleurotus ostreatus]|nr:hypothetical protein PTI98_010811 [Pleurotus ostreatus]
MPATEVTKLVSISPLPEYSPSSPAPEYSDELLLGEERLEHTPRPDRLRPTPTGVFVKKAGRTSIVLNEQEDGVRVPSYGRHAVVSGAICLENPSIVEEVTVKLDGRMDLTISEGGSKSHKLVNETYTLWSRKDATAEQPICPYSVPFSLLIPSTYEEGDKTRPLPPSFDTAFPGVPGLFAKCIYTLVVTIVKIRHRKMTWLTKNKTISIRLHYHPRTRPHRPNVSSPCLFSSLKVAPEEWQQATAQMQPRPSSSLTPIDCHLMVPAAQIFGLEEAIPFHIQLTGTIASLRAFLPQSTEVYPLSPIDTTSTVDTSATLVHSPFHCLRSRPRPFPFARHPPPSNPKSTGFHVLLPIRPQPPSQSYVCSYSAKYPFKCAGRRRGETALLEKARYGRFLHQQEAWTAWFLKERKPTWIGKERLGATATPWLAGLTLGSSR